LVVSPEREPAEKREPVKAAGIRAGGLSDLRLPALFGQQTAWPQAPLADHVRLGSEHGEEGAEADPGEQADGQREGV
jgi:hypothetical protein